VPDNSFDIVSKSDLTEVANAIAQAMKEIVTRFDLKDSKSSIEFDGKETLTLQSADEYKLKAINDVLQAKLVKRGISLKSLTYGALEPAAHGTVRQKATLQQGVPVEKAKEIVKFIKDAKLKKVQASIQGDQVRVTSPSKDELQMAMQQLRAHDFGVSLSFGNYR